MAGSAHMFIGDGPRACYVIAPGLRMKDLYRIISDRLEYSPDFDGDIDAVTQQACVEVEKRLGIFPNIDPPRSAIAKAEGK